MRSHADSGGPLEAASRIRRRGRNTLALGPTGIRPAGGAARRAWGDRDWLHRQPAHWQRGCPQSCPSPSSGCCARGPSRSSPARL
jgi:hypothetical protein